MGINEIIIYIMTFFMVLGALDRIFGNKFKIGEQFEEGIIAMGSLALSMVGIIALAPVLADVLLPIVGPVFKALGADPSVFATSLLALDMGGYPLAQVLAETPEAAQFSGVIIGSMMGPTIVFSIPVALGIISKEDHPYLAKGILAGMVTIPIGCLVGGLVAGFEPMMVIKNLIPIIIFSIILAIGLLFAPEAMIKIFDWFGKLVTAVITVGLAAGIVETLTGLVIIPGMGSLEEGFSTVGNIAIVLAGAYVLVFFITKFFSKPLMKVGEKLGMNEVAAAGLIATLANNIPMFGMMKDMDVRGKVINVAFCVSAAFVFGDHLGFVAGVNETSMIAPMIVGKLVGGITGILMAMFILKREKIEG